MDNYINKIDMMNKIMLGHPLNAITKIELLKPMIKNVFNEKRLFENMTYFNDIETIIYICL